MIQIPVTMTGYFDKGKMTKREQFLAEMEQVMPWQSLYALIEPHYPKRNAAGGRPPRVLVKHYRPGDSDTDGPSWLTLIGHAKDSL